MPVNEFDPLPADNPPAPRQATAAAPPKKESLLTRPLLLGQSLPWLAGIALILLAGIWFLFLRGPDTPDAGQLAFGSSEVAGAVQSSPVPATAAPAPLQTGGLSATASMPDVPASAGSVPEDVVKLIREGREFEAANREAITRLSDTVRAQNVSLGVLQKRLDELAAENGRLANQLTVMGTRMAASPGAAVVPGKSARRTALSGMRLESLQDGMAWISWQGRTWAVQSGDSLGGVTVRSISVADRSVTTSAGVLR